MTAREDLERALGPYMARSGLIDAALNEHAHKIAELILKTAWGGPVSAKWVADLIDPEVTG